MKKALLILTLLYSSPGLADIQDCLNLFVGRVEFYRGAGLHRITLVNDQSDTNGSQWVSLTHWDENQQNQILSVLLAAKMTGSRVYVETSGSAPGNCNIATGLDRKLERVILQQGLY